MSKQIDQVSESPESEKPISKGVEAGVEKPVTIQPDAVPVMTPVTILQPVTAVTTNVPVETRFCECNDKCWWSYCCYSLGLLGCAGYNINLKLDKTISNCSTKMWLVFIISRIIGAGLVLAGFFVWG